MAYTSFRLRRKDNISAPDANPFGSYLRSDVDTAPTGLNRVDSDSALRADGFVFAVTGGEEILEFNAVSSTYTSVNLSWSIIELVDRETIVDGASGIFEIVLVYSKTGFPETVSDGTIIKTQTHLDDVYSVTHTGVASGRWAYYSLFLHWNQNGTGITGVNWYERVATLQELVPYNYGSSNLLWNRIPTFHRTADVEGRNDDPELQQRGHLQRFIDIFGFEMDRTRTLINSVMTQYDPNLTESESIDQLSTMFGLEVGVLDIGVSRTRQILQDIGYYRQRKGTIEATQQYITAISGCRVDVIESTTSPRYTFRVYAERSNLVADSEFYITSGTKKWDFSAETGLVTYTKNGSVLTITNTDTASAQFALTSLVAVPVDPDTEYWSSIKLGGSGSVHSAHWSASAGWATWSGSPQYENVMATNLSPTGRRVILMPSSASTMAYPVMQFGLGASATTTVSEWMVEPVAYGNFFNGDSDFGGFIYQDNFADHQWSGSDYASYSTYSTNRKKTIEAVEKLLPQILPVTVLLDPNIDYDIQYDWIPGKT